MQTTMMIFIIVAIVALLVQVGILIALFLQMKRTNESINRVVTDLHTRMGPILTRTQILLDENYRSVNYRYRETDKPHAFKFKLSRGVNSLKPYNAVDT